jgi:hypothetical protein
MYTYHVILQSAYIASSKSEEIFRQSRRPQYKNKPSGKDNKRTNADMYRKTTQKEEASVFLEIFLYHDFCIHGYMDL